MMRLIFTAGVMSLCLGAIAQADGSRKSDGLKTSGARPKDNKDAGLCWSYKKEARYLGFGFRHFVELINDCESAVTCLVSTNVNPERQNVSVDAHSRKEVMTYLDSPSSEFTATVDCKTIK